MWILYALLGTCAWASANVVDSMMVHRFEKRPLVLMWFFGMFRLALILPITLLYDVSTPYWMIPLFCGMLLFGASLMYIYLLNHIDTSVTQSAWAIESILLSILGFTLLGESWSILQTVGAVAIVGSVFLLSWWHRHVSVLRTLLLLCGTAMFAAPSEFGIKVTMDFGMPYLTALFWYLLGNGLGSTLLPFFRPRTYTALKSAWTTLPRIFYGWALFDMVLSMIGFAATTKAYQIGRVSLVTIANDVQPFVVILIAGVLMKLGVRHLPRELLTKQSILIKIVCFAFVSLGLVLLTL